MVGGKVKQGRGLGGRAAILSRIGLTEILRFVQRTEDDGAALQLPGEESSRLREC